MRHLLRHPKLTLAARIVLGLAFIAAAVPKMADPPDFAKAIWAYDLLPPWTLNPLALVLPWLELVCGLALCLGFWLRAAAVWTATLLLGFSLALAIDLARHHPVDCGCFGAAAPRTQVERLVAMRWDLLRDVGLLLLVAMVLTSTQKNPLAGGNVGKEKGIGK